MLQSRSSVPPDPASLIDGPYHRALAARARGDFEDERRHWKELERTLTVATDAARCHD